MKKSLKALALGALILPVGLLSACGDQFNFDINLNLNSAGEYAESSVEELKAYVQEVGEDNSNLPSYRIVIKGVEDGLGQKLSGFVVMYEDQTYNLAYKMDSDEKDEITKATVYYNGSAKDETANYMYAYIDYSSKTSDLKMKGNYRVPIDDQNQNMYDYIPSSIMAPQSVIMVGQAYSLNGILPNLTEEIATVKKAEQGGLVNYQVVTNVSNKEYTHYYMFEDNVLAAIKMEYEGMYFIMERYEGEINYPDFGGYKEVKDPIFSAGE